MGDEVELNQRQDDAATDLQREKLLEADPPLLHRGEAECVVICETERWPLIVHDDQGIEWAERRGVLSFSAVDLLALMAAEAHLRPGQAWHVYNRLCEPVGEPDENKAGMFAVRGWGRDDRARDAFVALVSAIKECPKI